MRALVVGIGSLATGHYLPWLAERPGVELGLLARRPAAADDAAARFGGRALTSWQDAAAFGADVAFNVTTDTAHADVLAELVRIGVPRILAEKPLVAQHGQERVDEHDLAIGLGLARAARDRGVEVGVAFNYRFFDTVRVSLATLAQGSLGAPTTLVADAHHACLSHTIDLMLAAGGPWASVSALTAPARGELPPTRTVAFTTQAGAAGSFVVSSARSWSDRLLSITALCERGRVAWSDLDADAETFDEASGYRTTTALGAGASRWDRYAASFRSELAAYLDAVECGAPAPVGIEAGLRELQTEAAIVRSAATGRPVTPDEEFPIDL